jgi:hypothetical protein
MAVSAISNGCVARGRLFMGATESVESLLQDFLRVAVTGEESPEFYSWGGCQIYVCFYSYSNPK